MRILHLFSNARWTGPAEPALNLCASLRRMGIEADFACPAHAPGPRHTMLETARDQGIEPILRFRLSKHRHVLKNAADRMALKRFLRERPYDIVHCHLDNDHRIALKPAAACGTPVVRSSYEGTGLRAPAVHAKLLAGTAFLIEPSQQALDHDAEAYGYPLERMRVVPGGVDCERFDPRRATPDGRSWLGIPPDAFVVGIVARMQPHRHYEDFFQAFRMLTEQYPKARAIVVGRGTHEETVGKQPVKDLGLGERVCFTGYLAGEDYVGMLRAFDVQVFLVPGSDGTCRAVREGMAMAKPVVAADRGMLREIVDDGKNGFVCDGAPEALCQALCELAGNRARARAMGAAAREKALATFSLDVQARAVAEVYRSILANL